MLDIGAGTGFPVTDALAEAGLEVYAMDASPRMVELFRARHPDIPVACEDIRTSAGFGLRFEGIVAVGVMFLLGIREQEALVARMAQLLEPGGRVLFSAPRETGGWDDLVTGHRSHSLGEATYRERLLQNGFSKLSSLTDCGGNHYYGAVRIG